MGNVNNCLINNIKFDEINVKSNTSDEKNKQINNSNTNQGNYLSNKYKFETVKEEKVNNNILNSDFPENKKNILKISPSNGFNLGENKNNINFNNVRYSNGIIIDNNVLFNSTRKSFGSRKSFEKSQNRKTFEKNNFTQENVNISENNYGSNKVINTEEESDNLIVLDYNSPKTNSNNENINLNNINGYNNNDGYLKNIKDQNELNPEIKKSDIINHLDYNNKNIPMDNNYINKENINNNLNNYINQNLDIKKAENKNDINEQTQKSDRTLKKDFIETTNIFKNGIPYSKPKLNLYITENEKENIKDINLNNNNGNIKDDTKDNEAYFNSKRNEEFNNTENINKKNEFENINTNIPVKNNLNDNNDEIFDNDFITNVRKINPSPDDNINNRNKEPLNNGNDYFKKEINDVNKINKEEENILYQTTTLNNDQEIKLNNINNDYKNSNFLFNSNELNEGINSPIMKNRNKYFISNDNGASLNRRYFENNNIYEQNNINDEEIDELRQKLITQSEPKDKDSEFQETIKKSDKPYILEKDDFQIKNNNTNMINGQTNSEIKSDMKNNVYQKKNLKKINLNNNMKEQEQKDEVINNEELISENNNNINLDNLLTPSKDPNNIYKKKNINNTNEIINKKETKESKINEEENLNLNEVCEEFKDFDFNEWKRFYSQDDRFFKFPKEGINHNQEIKNPENDEIYKGDLNNNGEKHGYGCYISPNLKRIGMWRRNNFTGWGREIRNNGDIYEGKFINGKLNGKGIYKNKIKNISYIGDFINSEKHGKGELFTKENHYNGDFVNNKFEGKGKIEIYAEGEYEGDFKNGSFDGNGMLKWKNGDCYKGQLSKGKQHGYGEETDKDHNIYKGYFRNGNKDGEAKFITKDGIVYNLFYKDGKPIKNVDNN